MQRTILEGCRFTGSWVWLPMMHKRSTMDRANGKTCCNASFNVWMYHSYSVQVVMMTLWTVVLCIVCYIGTSTYVHIAFPPTVDGVNYYGAKEIVNFSWLVGLWYWTYVKPNQLIWCLHLVVSDTEACCFIYIPVWAWLSLHQDTSTKDSNWIDSLSGWGSTFLPLGPQFVIMVNDFIQ